MITNIDADRILDEDTGAIVSRRKLRDTKQRTVARLDELKLQPAPDNQELIAFAKGTHPYFVEKDNLKAEIGRLTDLIASYG